MSFTDRKLSAVIGTGSLMTGTLTLVDEVPNLTNEGWDTLEQTYLQRRTSCTAEEAAALFPIGTRLVGRTFWVVAPARIRCLAAGWWEFKVQCKGWASAKPAVVRVSAAAEQQSAENVDISGTTYAKVATHEATPTIAASYFVEDIDDTTPVVTSKTVLVGRESTPPVTIDVATTIWASLTEYVYHWPNGWVLMSSDQDRLPGTAAAWVTDNYKFIRPVTPG